MLRNDRGERPKKAFGGNQQSDEWNQKVDVCNINKNKVLIHLIILESSISDITDEGVLSRVYVRKGLMSKAQLYVETCPPVIWTGKNEYGQVEIWWTGSGQVKK